MDYSTENVTVMSAFFLSVLDIYKEKSTILLELQEILKDTDLSDPQKMQPMSKYNELLNWIDENLGTANAKITGKSIGKTIFDFLIGQNMIAKDARPIDIMKALAKIATIVISDPKKRGWEILTDEPQKIVMRKTQTFNTNIQFGVLEGLLYKCKKISSPRVSLKAETKKGAEFDDYELTWFDL